MLVHVIIFLLLVFNVEYNIDSSAGTLKNVDVSYVVCTIVKIIYIFLSLYIYIYAYIRMYMIMYILVCMLSACGYVSGLSH